MTFDASIIPYKTRFTGPRNDFYEAAIGGLYRDSNGLVVKSLLCYVGQFFRHDPVYMELLSCLINVVFALKHFSRPCFVTDNEAVRIYLRDGNETEPVNPKYKLIVEALRDLKRQHGFGVKLNFRCSNISTDTVTKLAYGLREKSNDSKNPKIFVLDGAPQDEELDNHLDDDRNGIPRYQP